MSVDAETELAPYLLEAIGPACHELRSPLAVVYGFAKMLEASDALDEQGRRYAGSVVAGAARMDELLEGLAQIGRVAAGRATPSIASVAIRPVIDGLAASRANGRRVTVEDGEAVDVRVDGEWFAEACRLIVDSCCFDDDGRVSVSWVRVDAVVHLRFAPHSQYSPVDGDPMKSGVAFELARIRLAAMGGSVGTGGGAVVVTLPA